ncbi:RICIN domain-containing protein [Streptomyces sp. NPDC059477]|uniref:RICIN domain-containing protein n=1 Tax=Streptomyces sp. NPDC059477 TaxID=3346847 RepID=UPI0036BA91DA
MPTPHPPRPPYPPPGGMPGESDESLATRLSGSTDREVAHSTALLTARHWRPAHDYAVICLAASSDLADMVTGAAFHQVLDRLTLGEQAVALRPRLLVAVRDTVRLWSADDRIAAVHPDVRRPAGGRGMRTAKSLTPENRVLAERAFKGLTGLAQCLLWHHEVEAEPISVPAALLGLDPDSASAGLEQARDTFREGLVRAHRELAPSKDCGYYNRLLDVPIRRGGALLPDVQQHLAECRYCRDAAEQLSHFEGGLDLLLAEAVLGWGARRYRDSRPGRTDPARRTGRGVPGGRHRIVSRFPLPPRRADPARARSPRALLTGVGLVSAGLLAVVLTATPWGDGGTADPVASDGAPGGGTQGSGASAPPGTAGLPGAPSQTRLRNAATDACLAVRGDAAPGAGTELAVCSAAPAQQWSYEADGLLRSVVAPDLCLDSHADAGVVILGRCADQDSDRADDVRYDLTGQGELLPRWDDRLALAPTTEDLAADIVVKVRDGSAPQRWRIDPSSTGPGSLSIDSAGSSPRAVEAADRDGTTHG